MTIINGKIPLYDLTALSVGGFLQANTAYWFEQWRIAAVRAGHNLTITSVADAYRNYAIQERIFRDRYTPQKTGGGYYNDVRWWNNTRYVRKQGHAAAAIPGTSNHGKGLAVDLKNVGAEKGAYYQWLAATGPSYGFTNTEGKSVNELWHWVHDNRPKPSTPAPKPELPNTMTPQEEDDMFTQEDRSILVNLYAAMFNGGSSMPGGVSLPQRIEDRLDALPNAVWMAPATGVDPKTGEAQTHPAVDWLTVMSFRIADGVSADAIVNAIPTEIAREVADLLAKRLKD